MSAASILISELADGLAHGLEIDGVKVVVVACDSGIYALEDRCSHEDFPLSEGEVSSSSCEIECARHGASFSLIDGTPSSFPATKPVRTYAVTVNGDLATVEAQ
ncbi:MAG: Rieske 2Fe-2S domain-containing protein [Actinobacteria bacterium]|nr:Rieske 2Fe-2S domain-containing protein [Actinomycetota bacterium]